MHLDSIKHFNIRNTFTKYQNTNYKGKTTFCCACDRKMWLVVENRSIFCSKSKHYVAQCQQKSSIRRIFDLRKRTRELPQMIVRRDTKENMSRNVKRSEDFQVTNDNSWVSNQLKPFETFSLCSNLWRESYLQTIFFILVQRKKDYSILRVFTFSCQTLHQGFLKSYTYIHSTK